jgi:hypothetical protein
VINGDGFSIYGDALKKYVYEMLIRASVPFWSNMHKWLTCRGTLFEKLAQVLRIIMRASWWLKCSIKTNGPKMSHNILISSYQR